MAKLDFCFVAKRQCFEGISRKVYQEFDCDCSASDLISFLPRNRRRYVPARTGRPSPALYWGPSWRLLRVQPLAVVLAAFLNKSTRSLYTAISSIIYLSRILCLCVTIAERSAILLVSVIKLTKETRRRVRRGRDWRWRDRKGTDWRGRVWRDFSLFNPNQRKM